MCTGVFLLSMVAPSPATGERITVIIGSRRVVKGAPDNGVAQVTITAIRTRDLPVGRHFTFPGHSVGDMLVLVNRSGFRSPTEKAKELLKVVQRVHVTLIFVLIFI